MPTSGKPNVFFPFIVTDFAELFLVAILFQNLKQTDSHSDKKCFTKSCYIGWES